MKSLFVLYMFSLCACAPPYARNAGKMNREECFNDGGAEFQAGMSGGFAHNVCVWRK